ncbi:MAG: dihydroorotase family protein [Methanobacterium sp.]|uniref:dihydroorotase n=1 Tax=Methanobacterium sp. TaxID=2164 RepID=UPI003D64A39E|nr:dihydroorotase family protein [Methanobacterium sp.]
MVDLCLINCKIVPENRECSIGIEEGKIAFIKKIPPKCEKTIDLKGNPVLPGLIDSHVHFRDPGLNYKEDFRSGSMSAAAGGFTTVIDMPNTKPPTATKKAFLDKKKIAEKKSIVDFALHASVYKTEHIKPLSKLRPASFKIYNDLVDNGFIMEIFKEVSKLSQDQLISVHAEDKSITDYCMESERTNSDSNAKIYANARPPLAEIVSVSTSIALANFFNVNTHICHVSTSKSLELVNQSKNMGCKVTSEITPHHLFLDDSYFEKWGNLAKTNPPLRDNKNRLKISDLKNIDTIGTDHAPHTLKEKKRNVWEAPPGIPNLDTTLPLLLTQINQNKMGFGDIKRLLCENPAKIFKLENKGMIKEGMDADFVFVDMKKESIITPENFKTKAKYSPFSGFKVKGTPVMTMIRGNVVMENGEIFENKGKFVY